MAVHDADGAAARHHAADAADDEADAYEPGRAGPDADGPRRADAGHDADDAGDAADATDDEPGRPGPGGGGEDVPDDGPKRDGPRRHRAGREWADAGHDADDADDAADATDDEPGRADADGPQGELMRLEQVPVRHPGGRVVRCRPELDRPGQSACFRKG